MLRSRLELISMYNITLETRSEDKEPSNQVKIKFRRKTYGEERLVAAKN